MVCCCGNDKKGITMSFENEINRTNMEKKKHKKILIVGYAVVAVLCLLVMFLLGAFEKNDKEDISSASATPVSSWVSVSSETSDISSVSVSSENYDVSSIEESSSEKVSSSSRIPSATISSQVSSKQEQEAYIPNGDWRLVIANKKYPLPKSYVVNTVYLAGGYRIDSRVADAYKSMILAAKNDGIVLNLISGFRTYAGQTSLYNNKVNQYINQGYSKEKANEFAAQYVAPPGTSEHLTGLAVDLISTDWYSKNQYLTADFEKTKEFQWLYAHCAEFGFILRYPKDKVDVTGYSYEPWHYRYVGVEAAKEIMSKKICLEEYVAQL